MIGGDHRLTGSLSAKPLGQTEASQRGVTRFQFSDQPALLIAFEVPIPAPGLLIVGMRARKLVAPCVRFSEALGNIRMGFVKSASTVDLRTILRQAVVTANDRASSGQIPMIQVLLEGQIESVIEGVLVGKPLGSPYVEKRFRFDDLVQRMVIFSPK